MIACSSSAPSGRTMLHSAPTSAPARTRTWSVSAFAASSRGRIVNVGESSPLRRRLFAGGPSTLRESRAARSHDSSDLPRPGSPAIRVKAPQGIRPSHSQSTFAGRIVEIGTVRWGPASGRGLGPSRAGSCAVAAGLPASSNVFRVVLLWPGRPRGWGTLPAGSLVRCLAGRPGGPGDDSLELLACHRLLSGSRPLIRPSLDMGSSPFGDSGDRRGQIVLGWPPSATWSVVNRAAWFDPPVLYLIDTRPVSGGAASHLELNLAAAPRASRLLGVRGRLYGMAMRDSLRHANPETPPDRVRARIR